jgi:hypothetical protein
MLRGIWIFALVAATVAAAATSSSQTEPSQVRVSKIVDVFGDEPTSNAYTADGRVFTFRPPVRCDADGTIVVAPYQSLSSGQTNDVLLRIASGGLRTILDLPAALGLAPGISADISATAMDAAGNVYALASIGGERRVIASWDPRGQFRSKRELDESNLAVHSFGVFATGEFLVIARDRQAMTDVIAITDGTSQPRRIKSPFADGGDATERLYAEPGPNGRIYLAQASGDRVYPIAQTGSIGGSIEIARPSGQDIRLISLHISHGRLVSCNRGSLH